MDAFKEIQEKYNQLREEERKKLRNYLKDNGFLVKTGGTAGKGRTNYTSGKRLKPPYDLSNWKYVEASLDEVNFLLSLQPYDIDPGSHSMHNLDNRLGVFSYVGKYVSERAIAEMKITDIELPLDDEMMNRLCEILKQIAGYQKALNKIYEENNWV